MLTKSQLQNKILLINAIVDNNILGVKYALTTIGFNIEGLNSEQIKQLIMAKLQRGLVNQEAQKLVQALSQVPYINVTGDYTGGMQKSSSSGTANRGSSDGNWLDDAQESDWGQIVGAVGLSLASLFGASSMTNTNTSGVQYTDNTSTIMGMQKTMFYGILALGAVLIVVMFVMFRKK